MPLSHRRLAAWYVQVAQQLEAGLPLAVALRTSRGRTVETMAGIIERGGSVDDALRAGKVLLPTPDQLALSAAAGAGRMPHTLRALAARHAALGKAQVRIVLACLYPLGVLHVGLFLLPITRMIDWEKGFHWSLVGYLQGLASTLVPLWIVIAVVLVLARRQSPLLGLVARLLPALRGYMKAQALADMAFGLGNFLEAGVPIGRAWAAVGVTTRSTELRAAAESLATMVERGQPPGTHLASWRCFPAEWVAEYRTGEATGHLEASLARLTAQYQDAATRALTLATLIYPALMFLIVAGGVAYFVITLYAGYLKMLTKMAE
jgi:type II secretory pathway component PulF